MKFLQQSTFREPENTAGLTAEGLVVHQRKDGHRSSSLIILVHGLGGKRYGKRATWGRIPEFIFEDFPYLDVGLYEYRTLFRRMKFWESISLRAEAAVFAGIVREADEYERIIMLGHSMGGLLCLAAMCHLHETNQRDSLERIGGLLLMATPQTGSQRVPGWLSWLSADFQALRPHGAFVTHVQRTVVNALQLVEGESATDRMTIPTWALLGSSDFWVDRLSAGLSLPERRCLTVRGSHTSIVKPASKESDAYRFVRKCVATCLSLEPGNRPESPTQALLKKPVILSPLPSPGVLYDRQEVTEKLEAFLADPQRRTMLLHGFPGIGRTSLAAHVVELRRADFDDVFWLECRSERATADVLFANLHTFLEKQNDPALAGIWNDPHSDSLPQKVNALIDALNRAPYLLVLDEFDDWLDRDLRVQDRGVGEVLRALSSTTHYAKLLLICRSRRSLEEELAFAPTGATAEEAVLGLPLENADELLRELGLRLEDKALLERVVDHFSGNPGMLKIYAHLVATRHLDPVAALSLESASPPLVTLLTEATRGLEQEALDALRQISVFRLRLPRKDLDPLGINFEDACVPLIDRFLVGLDPSTDTLTTSAVVRDHILHEMSDGARRAVHRRAAEHYRARPAPETCRSLDDLRPSLEEVYHRLRCGDGLAGADRLFAALPTLLDWGYIDLSERELVDLEHDAPDAIGGDPRRQGLHALLLGRLHDLRGDHAKALAHLERAKQASEKAGDAQSLAEAEYRIGRIHNARSEFDIAQAHFERSLAVCGEHGLSSPRAATLISIAWNRRNREASNDEVLAAFREGLAAAEETGDRKTQIAAHRQIGFLLWDMHRKEAKTEAESHYSEAVRLAERHGLVRELAAAISELGYLHDEWGQTGEAEACCLRAIDISEDIGDLYLRASARCNLAKVFESREDWRQAVLTYEKSIEEFQAATNESGEAFARLRLGALYLRCGDTPAARENLAEARQLGEKNHLQEILRGVDEQAGRLEPPL